MNIYLGNIQFSEIEDKLGYRLSDSDKEIWNEYHSPNADLSGKPSAFHVFDMPRCIQVKGEAAKQAIIKMFTPDKMVRAVGQIHVYEIS